jgi:hypothetical protein
VFPDACCLWIGTLSEESGLDWTGLDCCWRWRRRRRRKTRRKTRKRSGWDGTPSSAQFA